MKTRKRLAPHLQRAHLQWKTRQISIWAAFAFLYAGPCFLLARAAGYESLIAAFAMFLGVLTYVAALSAITSTWKWRKWEVGTSFGLALSIGRCLRGVMAVFSGAAWVWPNKLIAFAYWVDFASGNLAIAATEPLRRPAAEGGLIETYLTTLLTGFGVLMTLAILTGVAVGGVKIWRLFQVVAAPRQQTSQA